MTWEQNVTRLSLFHKGQNGWIKIIGGGLFMTCKRMR